MIRRIAGTTVAGIIGFICTAHAVLGGGQVLLAADNRDAIARAVIRDGKVYTATWETQGKPVQHMSPGAVLHVSPLDQEGTTTWYELPFGWYGRYEAYEHLVANKPSWAITSDHVIALRGSPIEGVFGWVHLGLRRLPLADLKHCPLVPRSDAPPAHEEAYQRLRRSYRQVSPFHVAQTVSLTSRLPLRYFDLLALDDRTIAVGILMGSRLTVWVDEPWKAEPEEVLQRFNGPLLLKRTGMAMEQPFPRWIRVAAIDAPFEEPFSAFAQGEDLYIVTDSGQTFLAKEVFKSMDPSQGEVETSHERPFVAERSAHGGMAMDREMLDRFQGTPTHELTPMAELAGTRHVVIDEGHLLFVSDDAVTDTKLRRTPMRRRPPSDIPAEAEGHMRTVLECLPAILDARQARE